MAWLEHEHPRAPNGEFIEAKSAAKKAGKGGRGRKAKPSTPEHKSAATLKAEQDARIRSATRARTLSDIAETQRQIGIWNKRPSKGR